MQAEADSTDCGSVFQEGSLKSRSTGHHKLATPLYDFTNERKNLNDGMPTSRKLCPYLQLAMFLFIWRSKPVRRAGLLSCASFSRFTIQVLLELLW